MDKQKRKRLEAAGYRFGDYGDFLGLTDEERKEVEKQLAARQPCDSSTPPRTVQDTARPDGASGNSQG